MGGDLHEEEEQEDNANGHGLRLDAVGGRSGHANNRNKHHAKSHANGTNHEEPATTEAIGSPGRIKSEEDTKGGPQGVDEVAVGSVDVSFSIQGNGGEEWGHTSWYQTSKPSCRWT